VIGTVVRPKRRRWLRRTVKGFIAVVCLLVVTAVVGGFVLANRFDSSIHRAHLLGDAGVAGADLNGPLNFLLIGSNYRADNPSNGERADSIMIVHVTADHSHAFLVSIPRDLYTTIKPDPKIAPQYQGSTEKIDAALNYGGAPLLSQTVSALVGIRFNGVIESRFAGFEQAVQALGGVCMYVDEDTTSVHVGYNDATGKEQEPYTNQGSHPIPVPGVTPVTYHKGYQCLKPWQALDFVRQRELLPNGDYDRQRHQQQFIAAVLRQTASAGTLSNPFKLDTVLHDIGQAMTIDTNGASTTNLLWTLHGVDTNTLVGLKTPSHPQDIDGTSYVVSDPGMPALFTALRNDTLSTWAKANPTMVNNLNTGTPPAAKH
jgi:LCP family protein required for cell wall assembly